VIGRRADRVAEADAWSHVAGLTVGQDISDRKLQFAAGAQFSLGKSRRGYGPMGPWLVTLDEVPDPDDLALGCSVDGEVVQDARTSDLVFTVPSLIAQLSDVLPLLPGDVLFTGTPAGVGVSRKPARFLQAGNVLETWIEGIGTIRNRCT
jgi:2-keto-4-pentenoate hydratase/2-oxohepta-3-ene-1,7-dioic acid hydratase in catechol pathway